MSHGYTTREIAENMGITITDVLARMNELRTELQSEAA